MKQLLQQYASYNVWANQRITDIILPLPKELQQKPIISSFSSLQLTLAHMWQAESIWWQRIKLLEVIQRPGTAEDTTIEEIVSGLLKQSNQWEQWVHAATKVALEHVFAYRNTKREEFKQPAFQMLLHLFNHQSYHRGQLVTMLRQLEVDKIPATDFIEWSRRKK